MNRKKKWSLLVMAQSPRPIICRSSKLLPTTRFTKEKGTEAMVGPSVTVMFCVVPAGYGLPALIANGPKDCRAATAGFPVKVDANVFSPSGVGVRLEEVAEVCARCASC